MRPIILLLALAAQVFAEPPKLEIPAELAGKACEPIEIPMVTSAINVKWLCFDSNVTFFPSEKLKDGRIAIVTVKRPGKYVLAAVGANDKGEQTVSATVLVVNGSDDKFDPKPEPPKPEPKPIEPPKPEPEPVKTSKLVVVVIEETAQAAEQRGKFFGDKALSDKITQRNHKVLAIDKDVKDKNGQVPVTLQGYLNQAAGKNLPWIVIVSDETKKVVFSGPMPGSAAEALALFIKYGG